MTTDGSDANAPQKSPRETPVAAASSGRSLAAESQLPPSGGVDGPATDFSSIASTPEPAAVKPSNRPPGFIRQYELVERVRAYDPRVDEDLLNKAYVFAMRAHGDQKRSSGDPYFSHPLAVAGILTDLRLDPATIATALLHDVVEDTDVTISEVRDVFGSEVARLVDGVTKISKRELAPDTDGKAENFVKFVMATAKDLRVLLVKLADRLHNMRTLSFIKSVKKRERIALETMEIFAPLAGRIGVHRIKEELEDLSFAHLNPDAFSAITDGLKRLSDDAVHEVVALSQTLRSRLDKRLTYTEVYSREKRAFSVWRKMQRKGSTFEELADIYAFRVIVGSVDECYDVLGVIHQAFPMIPDEFDDYISTPKPNGYQSIHTAVLATQAGGKGQRVEIQIRSRDMHDVAERGVAAHWRYKDAAAEQPEGDTVEISVNGKYSAYDWLQDVIGMLDAEGGAAAFLDQARIDLYQDQVFPFTPHGRVIPLPKGATPLDFAYAVHTAVGDQYAGAKINGVQRPNRTRLRNGDVVNILKGENAPLPTGWETFVVTGAAKVGLRRRIRALQKKEQFALGERIIRSAFAARTLTYSEKAVEEVGKTLGYERLTMLFESVGRMDISGQKVLEACFPNLDVEGANGSGAALERGGILPLGVVSLQGVTTGASVRLAPCCGPLPGERVIGVRDETGGIIAHRMDCSKLEMIEDAEWLNLGWHNAGQAQFVVPIVVTVNNRTGALGHIGSMLGRYGANIVDLFLSNREVDFSDLCLDIAVRDVRHLNNVLTGLRASDFVVAARRRDECDDQEELQ